MVNHISITNVYFLFQVLNISGNNVPSFGRNHFARLGLTNLQRVSAERCSLVQIDGLAFIGLTNLVELDLSLNKLVEVSYFFSRLKCLRRLYFLFPSSFFLLLSSSFFFRRGFAKIKKSGFP